MQQTKITLLHTKHPRNFLQMEALQRNERPVMVVWYTVEIFVVEESVKVPYICTMERWFLMCGTELHNMICFICELV